MNCSGKPTEMRVPPAHHASCTTQASCVLPCTAGLQDLKRKHTGACSVTVAHNRTHPEAQCALRAPRGRHPQCRSLVALNCRYPLKMLVVFWWQSCLGTRRQSDGLQHIRQASGFKCPINFWSQPLLPLRGTTEKKKQVYRD